MSTQPARVVDPSPPPLAYLPTAPTHAAAAEPDGLLSRAIAYFVTPRAIASPAARPVPAATRFAPRAAVLGSPSEAMPVAAALATAFRRRERVAVAIVVAWPAPAPRPRASTPAASRMATRLAARGLAAAPRGRLAWVGLEDAAEPAMAAAARVVATVDVPIVLAIGGPRTAAVEDALREQDLVAVVTRDPDGPLARLALAALDRPAIAVPPLTGSARLLALAGLTAAKVPLRCAP